MENKGNKMKISANEEKVLMALHGGGELKIATLARKTHLKEKEIRDALAALKERGYINGPPSLLDQSMGLLKNIDENIKPTDRGYAETIVLIASIISEADEEFLSDNLSYDREFIDIVGSRLRNSGVWSGNKIIPKYKEKMIEDNIFFFMVSNVASGEFVITGGTPDNPEFEMTASGKKRGEKLLKDMKP